MNVCEGANMKKQNRVEKGIVLDCITNKAIEADVKEINNINALVADLEEEKIQITNEKIDIENKTINFISVNRNEINEKEFLKIVEANKKHSYKRAGLYQQSLFERYLDAKEMNDDGYIQDIFEKAVELKENFETINKLKENKAFRKEWKKNFGKITPESILKRTGSMRLINIIKNSSM